MAYRRRTSWRPPHPFLPHTAEHGLDSDLAAPREIEVIHVSQPENSNLCGHACLAMVLGIDLEAAKTRMGHGRRTYTRELVVALGDHAVDTRLRPLSRRIEQSELPDYAILKVTWERNKGHFVVYEAPLVFDPDPAFPGPVTLEPYYRWWVDNHKGRVTSFLTLRRVLPDPC